MLTVENLGDLNGLPAHAVLKGRFLSVPAQKIDAGGRTLVIAGFAEVSPEAIDWYFYQVWFLDPVTDTTSESIYCKARGERI